jgi:hypothetical protein
MSAFIVNPWGLARGECGHPERYEERAIIYEEQGESKEYVEVDGLSQQAPPLQ